MAKKASERRFDKLVGELLELRTNHPERFRLVWRNYFRGWAQEVQRRESQIKALQAQIEKDVLTMSETERRAKEQELARQGVEYQRMQREYREDLNMRRNQEISALLERANRVIKQIADAEKYDLILQDAVYRNPRLDITDRVLKALAEGK